MRRDTTSHYSLALIGLTLSLALAAPMAAEIGGAKHGTLAQAVTEAAALDLWQPVAAAFR